MPETILNISRERWVQEIDKLLIGDYPENGLDMLIDTYLLKYMLPEVYLLSLDKGLWDSMLSELKSSVRDPSVRWGILLKDIAKVATKKAKKNSIAGLESYTYRHSNLISIDMVNGITSAKRLKFSKERQNIISTIAKHGSYEIE